MSMMSVLDKSITIISPDRNKKEIGDLRTRITEAYHTTKVRNTKLDLAFNNVKPKDWYFVLD